jgi:hypothetical protein
MRKHDAGLICAGGVMQSFLARMPSVLASVGPVLSVSLRVARRMTNSLRVGRAVDDPDELRSCSLIWIVLPESSIERMLQQLGSVARNLAIVVCGSYRESSSIRLNGNLDGARIATLNALDPGERVFAAEGHPDAIRSLRRATAEERRKIIELKPASKSLMIAGVHLAGDLVIAPFATAVESFRAAGFPRSEATRVAEILGLRALRSYSKAGRKAWSPGTAPALRRAIEEDLDAMRAADPAIAERFASAVDQALRYL